jgi:uncharacterized membrane protein YraQ (UPF0718 family)
MNSVRFSLKLNNSFEVLAAIAAVAALAFGLSYWPPSADAWSTFTTTFLGIFIEALPYLLLGTLASGLVEVYLDQDAIRSLMPKSAVLCALCGSLLGLFFPVCECGVVPLVRRLFRKGLPIPAGIAFLLAAPVINPIVILSTATAFGFGRVLLMRVGFTFLIAVVTGLVFAFVPAPQEVLLAGMGAMSESAECDLHAHAEPHAHEKGSRLNEIRRVFLVSLDEFFEMGRYLILGGCIAAGMQAFVPQSILLNVGKGPVLSVLIMMGLAVLLSICSTVDSFVALGFLGTFSTGSILAFLVFGAMVDVKSTLMFLRVLRPRAVVYLIALPFLLTLLICVSLNYFWIW